MKLIVKKLSETAIVPTYGSECAAGIDLYSDEKYTILTGQRCCVSTNICIEWCKNDEYDDEPKNYYFRIAPRSGLTVKNGINVGAGVCDYDYRGEIKIILFNDGEFPFMINKGDRIAQGVLTKINRFTEIVLREELGNTERGEKGFGSSGI